MKKVNVGDILQISTAKGVAFAQVTHRHKEYGYLIRVFSALYEEGYCEFESVLRVDINFSAFFPVQTAISQGLVSVVGNFDVGEKYKAFPVFRVRAGGVGGAIWLWDGEKSSRLERQLSDEEQEYPVRGIISHPLLVERIEAGYRAESSEKW